MLEAMLTIPHDEAAKLKALKKMLRRAKRLHGPEETSQSELINKDYYEHMRFFPKTMSKEELELEISKFVQASAKRYNEFQPDGIDKLVELTKIEPSLLYHCIKDSRGSVTSNEDAYFKKKYLL